MERDTPQWILELREDWLQELGTKNERESFDIPLSPLVEDPISEKATEDALRTRSYSIASSVEERSSFFSRIAQRIQGFGKTREQAQILTSLLREKNKRQRALDKDREYENLVIADVKRTIGLLKQWEIYKNHDIIRHRATLLIRRHNLKAEWNRRCIEVIDHTIQEMESMDGWNAIAAKLERIESEEKDTSHRRRSSIGLTKVEMLIESDDIIQKLTKRITKVENALTNIEAQIQAFQEQIKPYSIKKRKEVLIEGIKYYLWYLEGNPENEFVASPTLHDDIRMLVLDKRSVEGRLVHIWMKESREKHERKLLRPCHITGFVVRFRHVLLERFLSQEDIQNHFSDLEEIVFYRAVDCLIEQVIFPRIYPLSFQFQELIVKKRDKKFSNRLNRLKTLTQQELGIEPEFIYPIDESNRICAYPKAVNALSGLTFCITPRDMVDTISETIRTLHEEAASLPGNENLRMGADQLFPIVLYVLIHADLYCINTILKFLRNFFSEDFGQNSYYLMTLESMAAYAMQCDIQKLQTSDDIDESSGQVRLKRGVSSGTLSEEEEKEDIDGLDHATPITAEEKKQANSEISAIIKREKAKESAYRMF